MKNKINMDWIIAAGIRAIKTFAQTALGLFTVGMALDEVKWAYIASVAAVAAVYSLLTSVATGLPELSTDGIMQVDTSDPEKDVYQLQLDKPLDTLSSQKTVTFTVNTSANSHLK